MNVLNTVEELSFARLTGVNSGLVSEQLAHEVLSGIQNAVYRFDGFIMLIIICSNVAVLNTRTASLKFTT